MSLAGTRARVVGAFVVMSLGLVACSSGGSSGSSSSASATAGAPAKQAAFPVTVETPNGDVTIEQKPTKIVALSLDYIEGLLALGVEPMAAPALFELGPWVTDIVGTRSKIFTDHIAQNDASIEYIAGLEPNLIGGTSYLVTKSLFDRLEPIAPTISRGDSAGSTTAGDWEGLTRQLGAATGRSEQADELIETTLAEIAAVKAKYPGIAGTTVVFAAPSSSTEIAAANSSDHSGLRLLEALGLKVADLGGGGDDYAGGRTMLSMENLSRLDRADLVIMGTFSAGLAEELRDNPIYQGLDVVKEGRVLELDTAETTAFNVPTALNIPTILKLLEPQLQKLQG